MVCPDPSYDRTSGLFRLEVGTASGIMLVSNKNAAKTAAVTGSIYVKGSCRSGVHPSVVHMNIGTCNISIEWY